jgi:hypothetical protein
MPLFIGDELERLGWDDIGHVDNLGRRNDGGIVLFPFQGRISASVWRPDFWPYWPTTWRSTWEYQNWCWSSCSNL